MSNKKNWGFGGECGEAPFVGRRGGGGGGACENPVRLSMYDNPMETVEYIWENIW